MVDIGGVIQGLGSGIHVKGNGLGLKQDPFVKHSYLRGSKERESRTLIEIVAHNYRNIPRKRPWALNPSSLNRAGVGAYLG